MSARANPARSGGRQYGDQKTTERNVPTAKFRQISLSSDVNQLTSLSTCPNLPRIPFLRNRDGGDPCHNSDLYHTTLLCSLRLQRSLEPVSPDLSPHLPTQEKSIFMDARSKKEVCAQWDNPLYGLNGNRAASISASFTPFELWHL